MSALLAAAALATAAGGALLARRVRTRRWGLAALGVGLVGAAVVVVVVAGPGVIVLPAAAVGGVGLGLVLSRLRRDHAALVRSTRPETALGLTSAILAVGLLAWVGANDPVVGWFGPLRSHGPRHSDQVAITFDDGPDPTWSLAVAEILEANGTRGTFFEVGRAVDQHPEVARALHDRGHLLANHSYHHDYWRWLDPRYPELDRTQDALRRQVGVCPALFRPPHGQRTPFMLHRVQRAGLRTVTWDVSAEDWADDDGRRVARRIVDQARPGSIILLHDGLDGEADADRSVLRTALPLILEGLADQDLIPVRLDELLDVPGYLPDC